MISKVPIYLTARDRLVPIKLMLDSFAVAESVGRIRIIDCASTYPPLLEWYKTECPVEVIHAANLGNRAPWNFIDHTEPHYFVSDCDFDLEGVPGDFLTRLCYALNINLAFLKVGLSIRIDDLPDDSPIRDSVLRNERQWWSKPHGQDWYMGSIDTSPAVYRTGRSLGTFYGPALIAKPPYCCRHLSWYVTPTNITEEWRYYFEHAERGKSVWSQMWHDFLFPEPK